MPPRPLARRVIRGAPRPAPDDPPIGPSGSPLASCSETLTVSLLHRNKGDALLLHRKR